MPAIVLTQREPPTGNGSEVPIRDAASLIIYRRDPDGAVRMLMGRRSQRHVFMPGMLVFPGGAVEPQDSAFRAPDRLQPATLTKLLKNVDGRSGHALGEALALAAIRETYEETGVHIGATIRQPIAAPAASWQTFLARGVMPTVNPLRFVARAITPPGLSRRFDARFFAVSADHIAAVSEPLHPEFDECGWFTFEEARGRPVAGITRSIMDEVEARLRDDPQLAAQGPVPFFHSASGREERYQL